MITTASSGSGVHVVQSSVPTDNSTTVPVRIVGDSGTPEVRPADDDKTLDNSACQLSNKVNQAVGNKAINMFDVVCLQNVYRHAKERPEFMYRPFAKRTARYSDAFTDWIIDNSKAWQIRDTGY